MDFPRLCPARLLSDQHFGMCITPHDYLFPLYDMSSNYYRPWRCIQKTTREFGTTVENEKGNYKITLDVQNFRPNETTVKVTENEIIVEGQHEERADTHGFVMRQFKRRYTLPNHCPPENVTSTLSSDGVLIIIAEKSTSRDSEKIVPIKMCGISPRKDQIESKTSAEMTQKECVNEVNETMEKATNQLVLQAEHSRLLKPELLKEVISENNGENTKEITKESIKSTGKNDGNLGATSSVLEESLKKTNLEMLELVGKMGQHSSASSSQMSRLKSESQTTTKESSSYKSSMSTSSNMRTSGKASEFINEVIRAELREAAENI